MLDLTIVVSYIFSEPEYAYIYTMIDVAVAKSVARPFMDGQVAHLGAQNIENKEETKLEN